jgi:mannosyltransferase OCH1-like enzyme
MKSMALDRTKFKKVITLALCVFIALALIGKLFTDNGVQSSFNGGKDLKSTGGDGKGKNFDGNLNDLFKLRLNDQAELSDKLDQLAEKLFENQEKRLAQLEADKMRLERQLKEMKKPSRELSLREQLAFVFPYDQKLKFPAYIWQTWKFGLNDERFGEDYKHGEEQWAVMNPGFIHELFNDDTSNALIRYLYMHLPDVVRAYNALPHIALKMDFFRYLVLFAKGGIYADVDTVPLQPIPNWIPENVDPSELGMIIGIESDPIIKDWRKFYVRRLQFANWVIQAKPGHPILREIIASITETTLRKMQNNDLYVKSENDESFMLDVMEWTGDGAWTDVIFRYFNDYVRSGIFFKVTWKDFTKMDVPKLVSDVLVLPLNSFNAGEIQVSEDAAANVVEGDETHALAFVKHFKKRVFKLPSA